jgi:hypothetical protein
MEQVGEVAGGDGNLQRRPWVTSRTGREGGDGIASMIDGVFLKKRALGPVNLLPRRQIRRRIPAPVTVENTFIVFSDRKTVFRMYDDQFEPRQQVHGLSMYFTLPLIYVAMCVRVFREATSIFEVSPSLDVHMR